ncbi:hypothetical protein L226DRAFT_141908 [Lentinus tigrinus ALCF2SS1-7]|uniref:uncharacterized protein n=1 Tax=Lentinus tigrinus ALCF2SS1-7 TaxID=1328758 RepID=UPI001165F4F6|nr:hypothetical protein L226DRAFT_141908 [Lentinus tigrinus ALCF2SS1-7]
MFVLSPYNLTTLPFTAAQPLPERPGGSWASCAQSTSLSLLMLAECPRSTKSASGLSSARCRKSGTKWIQSSVRWMTSR